jgi:hypothetical protein
MASNDYRTYSGLSADEIERLLKRAHRERSEYLTRSLSRLLRRLRLQGAWHSKLAPQPR